MSRVNGSQAAQQATTIDPDGYAQAVQQILSENETLYRLLDMSPERISQIKVNGEDVTVHAGPNAKPAGQALLQKYIDEHTTDTPVQITVVHGS